jgi:gamma-glutamyltranspeptidase / glutathione hydrolase
MYYKNKSHIFIQKTIFYTLFGSLLTLYLVGCKLQSSDTTPYQITKEVNGVRAGVSTAHPLATKVGIDILKQGGNAADAAIAVQFALAVCYPGAGNIGGGGFLLYRDTKGQVVSLDFREKAPKAATTDMYLDSLQNPITDASFNGALAAGVPGSVDGMVKVFEKLSKLKNWQILIQPAVELAEKGFPITQMEADNLNEHQALFEKYNKHQTAFHKKNWQKGDLLVQPQLANTLKHILSKGRDGFYKGEVADQLILEMKRGGGIISKNDLESYQSVWRSPLSGNYRGYKIYSMGPPSSGGVALLQMLQMTESYPLNQMEYHSAAHVHLMAEVERRSFADRAYYLGDPDFVDIPLSFLMDSSYLSKRMSGFNPRMASISDSITHGKPESEETTHFSIVDSEGNAASVTTTLNGSYGALTVVEGAGFFLNNEMDDFSIKPGFPNMYGLVGGEANKIEPEKRMLSSMTPTIITKNDSLFMVVGTPGGSTIITSVFQVIVNVIDFNMSLFDAVNETRFHHQWKPDQIYTENGCLQPNVKMVLESLGHKIKEREPIGRVEAILVDKNKLLTVVADPRGDDDAKGY